MKGQRTLPCILLYLAFIRATISEKVDTVRHQEARLMKEIFSNYKSEFLPRLNESEPVEVRFNFELINIKEVNAKDQFIAVYGWVRQTWHNPLLQWNASEYGGYERIMVDAKKVWVPDIFLYNNFDVQDRVGGGTETYKTQVVLYPDGKNSWKSPAIFNSLCDIDVTYFPFDVQSCPLKFGSWSRTSADVMTKPENVNGTSANYIKNGEWELISATWKRNIVPYGNDCYDDVTLTIKIGRDYQTYFVNLVIPCALISTMIFLSFLLPPECGERISLGITVLLAMTVFQQLTQQLFPSFEIPLLGQYYMATILEISLALVATAIVLNFKFRKNTKMPSWWRKFFFNRLSRLVGLKETVEKSRPKPRRRSQRPIQRNTEPNGTGESRFVQELKKALKTQTLTMNYESILYNRATTEGLARNGTYVEPSATTLEQQEGGRGEDVYEDVYEFSGIRDENGQELHEDELALREWEWSMAASILDRLILGLSIIIGVVTFLAIFLQAPRVQDLLT